MVGSMVGQSVYWWVDWKVFWQVGLTVEKMGSKDWMWAGRKDIWRALMMAVLMGIRLVALQADLKAGLQEDHSANSKGAKEQKRTVRD